MLNKILIGFGLLSSSILLIENAVQPIPYIFLWSSSTMFLSFISIVLGVLIGFGLKGFFISSNEKEDDNLDF